MNLETFYRTYEFMIKDTLFSVCFFVILTKLESSIDDH